MTQGAYISGFGHAALILWALVGGFFLSARDPLPVQASDVSLISSAEFAALTLPDQAPPVPFAAPEAVEPAAQDEAPEITPSIDATPAPEIPDEVTPPESEAAPVLPEPANEPVTEVADELPAPPVAPTAENLPVLADPDETPTPAPAPRVAPVAAPAPAPDAEVAETETPEVTADEGGEVQAEETPAAAPQEAATEIVTEAEVPSSAPLASRRPTARPARPVQVTEPAQPAAEPVAPAATEPVAPAAPTVAQTEPTGPPLTGSETEGFRVAVSRCWNVDGGSAAARITVTVAYSLDRDGKVKPGTLKMIQATDGEPVAVNAAFEAARRAIIRCGAKGFDLPLEKYARWKDIEMTFNPEGMRIK